MTNNFIISYYKVSLVDNTIDILVETLTGKTIPLKVDSDETIENVKVMIRDKEGVPLNQQHLIFMTTQLDDRCRLSKYNISENSTLQLLLSHKGKNVFVIFTCFYIYCYNVYVSYSNPALKPHSSFVNIA